MGWVMGFEPTNTGTTIRCLRPLGDTHHMNLLKHYQSLARQEGLVLSMFASVQPSAATLIRIAFYYSSFQKCGGKNGTPGGTRTPDLLLRRQLLYPAELLAHISGAGDGNRTRVSSLEGWCSTIELHPRLIQL